MKKNIKVILLIIVLLSALFGIWLKGKAIDDIFQFLDKGVGHWKNTGRLIYPKDSNTSLLLMNDGNILVAGGTGKDSYRTSDRTQIYLTRHNKFTKGPKLLNKRVLHHTFQLKNGEIILIGGQTDGKNLNNRKIEKLDFTTMQSSYIGEMLNAADYDYLMQLKNGSILNFQGRINIWYPETNKTKTLPLMNFCRMNLTATELKDKSIIFTGGIIAKVEAYDECGIMNKYYENQSMFTIPIIERYNPSANKFIIDGKMIYSRAEHSTLLLPDGNILIVGGRTFRKKDTFLDKQVFKQNIRKEFKRNFKKYHWWQDLIQDVELYNPQTKTSKIVARLNYAVGKNMALTLLQNRYVLVSNGSSYRDEIIDTKTWKVYYTKKNKRITNARVIKLDDKTVLYIGSYMGNAVPYGMLFIFDGVNGK